MNRGQTRAQAIREEKRQEIIESLRARGLVQQVVETSEKLADLSQELDTIQVQRLRAANDSRLALVKKYLPDMKQSDINFISDLTIEAYELSETERSARIAALLNKARNRRDGEADNE